MFERLRVIIDVQAHNAKKMLTDFGSSIRDADGMAGKFKAGWRSATDSIKANAATLALTAGAALVTFAVKAVAAFEDASKAAIDFGKATGQTTEAASRWIAVADDFEVSTSALQTAMGRAGRQGLDFIDVLEQINNAEPAERAKVAYELLGKSWQSVAPLLGKTRAEYEAMLGAVEKGQVITEEEAAKAERMRLAQDALSDALNEVTLAFGEAVAEMAPMIEGLATAVGVVTDLNDRFGDYIAIAKDVTNPFDALNIVEDLQNLEGGVISATVAVDAFGYAAGVARPTVEELMGAFGEAHDAAGDVKELSDEFAGLLGLLDVEDLADEVVSAFDDVAAAAQEAWDAGVSGAADAEAKNRDYERSVRDLKRDVIDFGDTVDGLPKERVTEILTAIDEGSMEEAERLFAQLQADVIKTITVNVNGKFNGNISSGVDGKFAAGGSVPRSGSYLVGELGPEIVNLPGGANVIPNNQLGGGGELGTTVNQTITINAQHLTPAQIAAEIRQHAKGLS